MLRFTEKCTPGSKAGVLISKRLRVALDEFNDEESMPERDFKDHFPLISSCFSRDEAKEMVKKLLEAHEDSKNTYHPTDYHFALLYELLEDERGYCGFLIEDGENGHLPKETTKKYKKTAETLEHIIEVLFWDHDFLITKDEILDLNEQAKDQLGFSPEVFGIIMGMKPHPDEVKLEKWDE